MPNLYACPKGGNATSSHKCLGRSLDDGDLTGKHIHHLVFSAVPMLDRGSAARLQHFNECAKLREFASFTDPKRLIRFGRALYRSDLGYQLIRRKSRHDDTPLSVHISDADIGDAARLSLLEMRGNPVARQFPKRWRAALDCWAVSFKYLFIAHLIFRPGAAVGKYIHQQGLDRSNKQRSPISRKKSMRRDTSFTSFPLIRHSSTPFSALESRGGCQAAPIAAGRRSPVFYRRRRRAHCRAIRRAARAGSRS